MPIHSFEGDTFVAFTDISGFKELFTQGNRAWRALDKLYQLGYHVLREFENCEVVHRVEGFFVSDCGILFVRSNHSNDEKLRLILEIVGKINKGMLEDDFMLTTSIAYGAFKYQHRIEFQGIEKNAIYGNAYLAAYLDNEFGKPTIQPGQCRILIDNLPGEITSTFFRTSECRFFSKIRKGGNRHYYYYWNVEHPEDISAFKKQYRDAYNLKYSGMLKALKDEYD